MHENIIEHLKKKKLTSVKRSIASSDANEQYLHAKAQIVKNKLNKAIQEPAEDVLITLLANYYYVSKANYTSSNVHTRVDMSARRKAFWVRVASCCKKSGVTPEVFIKAQFAFFHKAFGTIPKLPNLATEAAVDRARAFVGNTLLIKGSTKQANLDLSALFSRTDLQIRSICKAQGMSRLDFYKNLVITGELCLPKEYLSADPVYKKALAYGK